VTVRITVTEIDDERLVQVDGRLTHAELSELELAMGDDPTGVCLVLGDLRSVDAASLAALRALRARGIDLRGVPPYIACRLEEEVD